MPQALRRSLVHAKTFTAGSLLNPPLFRGRTISRDYPKAPDRASGDRIRAGAGGRMWRPETASPGVRPPTTGERATIYLHPTPYAHSSILFMAPITAIIKSVFCVCMSKLPGQGLFDMLRFLHHFFRFPSAGTAPRMVLHLPGHRRFSVSWALEA